MAQTKFSLSWDAYQKSICKGLSYLQEKGEFVDMTLAADGHYVKVHKMILSLISPFIKELISTIDCAHPVIFLNNISYPTLCSILEYIYTGEVMVKKENLTELIQAGKALHIKGLDVTLPSNCFEDLMPDDGQNVSKSYKSDGEVGKKLNNSADPLTSTIKGEKTIDLETYAVYEDDLMSQDCEKVSQELSDKMDVSEVGKNKIPGDKVAGLQYTVSNQGGLQMILNRFVYNVRYMSKNSTRRRWNCINYPGKQRCPAFVTTKNERVIERGCSHNHAFHDRLIMKKYQEGMTFCCLKDAELQVGAKKKELTEESEGTA